MNLEITLLRMKEDNLLIEEFLHSFDRVKKFFRWNPETDWQACAGLRANSGADRNQIADILHDQNSGWQARSATMDHIQQIRNPGTLCLMTGQQVGIFGGPLYTLYKAITAVKLAKFLTLQFPRWNVVPCFWMEVGDNDYREINHIFTIDKESRLVRLSLPDQPTDFRSVSHRTIPPEIEEVHRKLDEALFPSEFKTKILGMLREEYSEGKHFSDAFARLLHHLLGDYGLVIIDPSDRRFKLLAKHVFRAALNEAEKLHELINRQNRELEKHNYPVQVRLTEKQTLLFLQADDFSRCRIDRQEKQFLVRHPKQPFTISMKDLSELLEEQPWRFSPNVLLRPVYQDSLFATLGYVGGPAELAYTAQLQPIYQLFNLPQPVFFPRARVTLVEKKIDRLVQKYGLNYPKIFALGDRLITDFTRRHSEVQLEQLFSEPVGKIEQLLNRLEPAVREIDPTLISALDKTNKQINRAFLNLKARTEQAFARKLDMEIRQLNRLLVHLYPSGTFQERKLNPVYFLAKYGPDFVANLYKSVSIEEASHQLIFL